MPRFQDEHVTALKRVMLKRVPECLFTPEDVKQIADETGLNHAQIDHWAENLRWRANSNTIASGLISYLEANKGETKVT